MFRGMIASDKRIAILTNWGNDDEITVGFQGNYGSVVDILTGAAVKTKFEDNNTLVTLHLAKDSVAVLLAQ